MTDLLTPEQIRLYAYNAGFRGDALNTAVAIALAESSGNAKSYNPETAAGTSKGSGSRGLWQIYGAAHPEYNSDTVFDPAKNAAAAFAVYQEAGNKFTPWSTYNQGTINKFLPDIQKMFKGFQDSTMAAASSATTGAVSVAAAGGGFVNLWDGIKPAVDLVNRISTALNDPEKIKAEAMNIGFAGVGSIVILIGVILLFYSQREAVGAGVDKVASGVKSAAALAAL